MKVLVTGGAGFIGSHTVDLLVEKGYDVVILDNLEPQVHGNKKPDYINEKAEFIIGDVTNTDVWKKALDGIDTVLHLAAMVGVGQSMYQPVRYLNVNTIGTARFYETLLKNPEIKKNIQKIIVASSMSIYGEGAYECKNCGIVYPSLRTKEQLEKKDWDIHCPKCDEYVKPIPVNEEKPPLNLSTYALSKYDQEKMSLNYGFALGISTVALRYFNVFGPRQSLNNPYTGVISIFICRIRNNNLPLIFEDGLQTRDFIFVKDVARANILALEKFDGIDVFNVGTGTITTIKDMAGLLVQLQNSDLKPTITNSFRVGDIRHAYGDISKIKNKLRFSPKISLKEGLKETLEWSTKEEKPKDLTKVAMNELKERGLIFGV